MCTLTNISFSLAYCEIYVTLGTLFRRFANLKGNELSQEDLAYNDYFSSQNAMDAKKFHILPPMKDDA